jgi:hypothetical protein
MKNPFANETVKSAAIIIGSAAAFIAISKGIGIIRKKFGGNAKVKAIFGSAENADLGIQRNVPKAEWNTPKVEAVRDEACEASQCKRRDYEAIR